MGEQMDVSVLIGQTLRSCYYSKSGKRGSEAHFVTPTNDEVHFVTVYGDHYRLYHSQECCEDVTIEDINGELEDLVGTPLVIAEVTTNSDNPPPNCDQNHTWTFYKFATAKGHVTIRWFGSSNGYYSEEVNFEQVGLDIPI